MTYIRGNISFYVSLPKGNDLEMIDFTVGADRSLHVWAHQNETVEQRVTGGYGRMFARFHMQLNRSEAEDFAKFLRYPALLGRGEFKTVRNLSHNLGDCTVVWKALDRGRMHISSEMLLYMSPKVDLSAAIVNEIMAKLDFGLSLPDWALVNPKTKPAAVVEPTIERIAGPVSEPVALTPANDTWKDRRIAELEQRVKERDQMIAIMRERART